jgi:PAS domain S-box-containing protein
MATPALSERTRPARVLVGADEVSLAHIRQTLSKNEYELLPATSQAEALRLLESNNPPQLAVLDWNMPSLGCMEICSRLRNAAHRQRTYLILLTQQDHSDKCAAAMEAGADDCLLKPVKTEELLVRLRKGTKIVMERAQSENEGTFRTAFESAKIGMALIDLEGTFVQVNPALCEFLGYRREELIKERLQELPSPQHPVALEETFRQILGEAHDTAEIERSFCRQGGAQVAATVVLSLIRDANRRPTGFLVQIRDIAKQRQTQDAMQRSGAFLRAVIDNVQALVLILNAEHKCIYTSASEFWLERMGRPTSQLLGESVFRNVYPEDYELLRKTLDDIWIDAQPRTITFRVHHEDGGWRYVEGHFGVMRTPAGQIESAVSVVRIVEDRVLAERRLRESEERYRLLFKQNVAGVFQATPEGAVVECNDSFAKIFGFESPEELMEGNSFRFQPIGEPSKDFFTSQRQRGESRSFESEAITKKQGKIWLMGNATVLQTGIDPLPLVYGTVFEITGKKRTEEALRRSEAFARAITDNVEDLVMVISTDHKWLYANQAHGKILGYGSGDLMGRDMLALLHPSDRAVVAQAVKELLKTGEGQRLEFRLGHKEGTWKHLEASGALLRNAEGGAEGFVIVARAIDDRIVAEQKLQAAYAETELFVESIPSILVGLDKKGHVTHWNATASHVFGLDREAVTGRLIDDCGIKWLHPEMGLEVTRWLTAESFYRSEDLAYELDGKTHFLGLQVRRISSGQDMKLAFILTGADVTERKNLEEQLRQSQKLEAIGQLAAGIAHEINTPTQYVGDNATFLKESWGQVAKLLVYSRECHRKAESGGITKESLDEFGRLIEEADLDYLLKEIPQAIEQSLEGLQRVARIVKGMKEFSHPGSQEKRAIDINKAIETTITVARHEWKYVCEVETHLDPSLPMVPCLAGEFNQVILNLIINSTHAIAEIASEETGAKGTITITTQREGEWVEISIRDTGGGIPPEVRSRIFEPFFTTKAVGKGTGQGLALAHSVIVNRHQGQIWFETELGQGTTFFIRLPLNVCPTVS